MLTLSILHNIFLTDEQIDKLLAGDEFEATGVSVPVWFYRGNTSEPADEVFCKYTLSRKEESDRVKVTKDGYEIIIPIMMDKPNASVSDVTRVLPPEKGGLSKFGFREYNTIQRKDSLMKLIHMIEMKPISELENSFN